MQVQRLTTEMIVPLIWGELLDLEEFPPGVPAKAIDGLTALCDREPYRDDCRTIEVTEGDWHIELMLCSGSNNYWLQWTVDGPGEVRFESEPEHGLPGLSTEFLIDMGLCTKSSDCTKT